MITYLERNSSSYALTMERRRHERTSAIDNHNYVIKKRFRLITLDHLAKLSLVVLLAICINNVSCEDSSESSELSKRMKILETVSGRFFSDVYENGTFRTGNALWDNILNKCTVNPSVSCLQKNVYSYLDDSLKFNGDVDLGHGVCFKKNNVDISKYSKEANIIYLTGSRDESTETGRRYLEEENEIEDDEPESPIEEVTDGLYDKGIKFLVTHDMKVTLPEWFFQGATLKISPRALTKTGALVHVDLEPNTNIATGRLFFHKLKKYVKKKLLTAAIAIILVVKLIALKLVFVLPLIMGVTTAKKMFLKFLLFLFPALSHIFKLCSWYHQNYHTTKYHHHHHLITHHHKPPHSYGHPSHGSSVVVRPHSEGPPHTLDHYPQDWELSGPGLGNEYVASGISSIHRNAIANFKPDVNDANDINSWGLGMPPGPSMNVGEYAATNNVPQVVPNPNTGQRVNVPAQGRPVGPPNPYRIKKQPVKDPLQAEKEALIRAAALAARAPPSPVRDELLRVSQAKLSETTRVRAETELVKQQQQILAAQDPELQTADSFYGGLLDKVDKILNSIGATDPSCRERAVCALYRDPFRHAPYSNLVSNELSKDSSELVPPADSKMALRYYQYVQAARDGQEQKDCAAIYANCNFEYNK